MRSAGEKIASHCRIRLRLTAAAVRHPHALTTLDGTFGEIDYAIDAFLPFNGVRCEAEGGFHDGELRGGARGSFAQFSKAWKLKATVSIISDPAARMAERNAPNHPVPSSPQPAALQEARRAP